MSLLHVKRIEFRVISFSIISSYRVSIVHCFFWGGGVNQYNRFGRNGEFAVIMSPTDQGYYEPDTSALLRLKLEQEYGYGNAHGTILSDKVNLLGTGAVPFWRWIEGSCRTPAGLGKIQVSRTRRDYEIANTDIFIYSVSPSFRP